MGERDRHFTGAVICSSQAWAAFTHSFFSKSYCLMIFAGFPAQIE